MTFQSVEYLLFFPILFIIYWFLCKNNKTYQNSIILISSLLFYSWWNWRFLFLLLITAFSTFFAACLIEKYDKEKKKILILTLILNIGILFAFKYFGFFTNSIIDAFSLIGISINKFTANIVLPVGISFYTFAALGYVIDVYQKKVSVTKDILAYLSYVTFFPSILSGPISRSRFQLPQYFKPRILTYKNIVDACNMFLWGAIMKLCLADRIGIYVDSVYSNINHHNGTTLFFTSVLYSIQIYADFAGYSLMAIGSGKFLGINLPTNFLRPYFAKTITDFWRRWHISLTTWFRDYIYFPLGGNRCSKKRWMFNTMVVFIVSGLWHGAYYTFVIWGALHGICMIIERLIYGDKIKKITDKITIPNICRLLLTFLIVNFAWIFFRLEYLSDVFVVIEKIIYEHGPLFLDKNTLFMCVIALILVLIHDVLEEINFNSFFKAHNTKIIKYVKFSILICYVISFGVLNGGSFIYFKF